MCVIEKCDSAKTAINKQWPRMQQWVLVGLLLLGGLQAFAQPPHMGGRRRALGEDIEALRVAFITQRVSLTPAEAQRFWPVFNQMQTEMREIKRKRRLGLAAIRLNWETLTDAELSMAMDEQMALRTQEAEITNRYHARYKEVLPVRKVALLYKAEQDFRRELIRRVSEWQQNQPHGGAGGHRGRFGGQPHRNFDADE